MMIKHLCFVCTMTKPNDNALDKVGAISMNETRTIPETIIWVILIYNFCSDTIS